MKYKLFFSSRLKHFGYYLIIHVFIYDNEKILYDNNKSLARKSKVMFSKILTSKGRLYMKTNKI